MQVSRARVIADGEGAEVAYAADHPLPPGDAEALSAAIRLLVGPVRVTFRHLAGPAATEPWPERRRSSDRFEAPAVLRADDVAPWLRTLLAHEGNIRWAALTGSSLDPTVTTRFSDIDLVIVVEDHATSQRWRMLARRLHAALPTLRVNVSTAADLADSPLIAARLCAERLVVAGDPNICPIAFPTMDSIVAEARAWAQTARAILWTQITATGPPPGDVLRQAGLGTKFAIDALRYHALCSGARQTQAAWLLEACQAWGVPELGAVLAGAEVAREHRPPPADGEAGRRCLEAALAVVDWLIEGLRRPRLRAGVGEPGTHQG